MSDDDAHLDRLQQVKHLVVVMMENRSFDHMLGYLKGADMPQVDGLDGDEYNFDRDGNKIGVHAFDADANHVMRAGEALIKALDPDHSPGGVKVQLGPGYQGHEHPTGHNGGFVRDFVESRADPAGLAPELRSVPMGYYTDKDVPVYDFIAHHYAICDRWHASVPGDTWPNRLFSLAGKKGDKVKLGFVKALTDLFHGKLHLLDGAPIYDVGAFTRHLRDDQWRWYSHDPATLRAADGEYRKITDVKRDNFAFFDRKKVSAATEILEGVIVGADSFLDDAAKGELRDVSWIDPNFIDLSVLDPSSNDDHPPADIRAGQAFILQIYEALSRSPNWNETLLVIVYDEHGGFYDHVQPPALPDDDEYKQELKTYGIRVPALLVGPMVKPGVCKALFDHTTLIKTILRRFAEDPDGALASMSPRVRNAEHLGVALDDHARTDLPDHSEIKAKMDAWRTVAREKRQATTDQTPSIAPDGAGQPLILQSFQQDVVRTSQALRLAGLPPGQP
jgi:phospholipase C